MLYVQLLDFINPIMACDMPKHVNLNILWIYIKDLINVLLLRPFGSIMFPSVHVFVIILVHAYMCYDCHYDCICACDKHIMTNLYYSFIYPYTSYCTLTWGSNYQPS